MKRKGWGSEEEEGGAMKRKRVGQRRGRRWGRGGAEKRKEVGKGWGREEEGVEVCDDHLG